MWSMISPPLPNKRRFNGFRMVGGGLKTDWTLSREPQGLKHNFILDSLTRLRLAAISFDVRYENYDNAVSTISTRFNPVGGVPNDSARAQEAHYVRLLVG